MTDINYLNKRIAGFRDIVENCRRNIKENEEQIEYALRQSFASQREILAIERTLQNAERNRANCK